MNGNTQVNPENKREIIESIGKDNKTKLTRFKYTIKDDTGKVITDYFDAPNKTEVESFLISQGYEIIDVREDKLSLQLGLGGTRTRKFSYK